MVGIFLLVFIGFVDISIVLSCLVGKEFMLICLKICELIYVDWLVSNNCIFEDINWFFGISLEYVLCNGLF